MMDDETKKWLLKAFNDYKTAERLIGGTSDEIITDTLCFHCEQFVEKSLKAFLVSKKIDFKRLDTPMNFIFPPSMRQKSLLTLPQKLRSLSLEN